MAPTLHGIMASALHGIRDLCKTEVLDACIIYYITEPSLSVGYVFRDPRKCLKSWIVPKSTDTLDTPHYGEVLPTNKSQEETD